jgi:hypothetical protein
MVARVEARLALMRQALKHVGQVVNLLRVGNPNPAAHSTLTRPIDNRRQVNNLPH